jgi:hypothetical protein
MLITNFAAGELSQNLFGRTDLPQYFSGASRIENFDVIPTGGLRRRSGTERMAPLETDGRIIPFPVNRGLNFLLYLTPLKITIFKIENGRPAANSAVFNNGAGLRLYADRGEIDAAQYAQNFDTMILCHENYPPLEVKLNNNQLTVNTLQMSFNKEVVKGSGISDGDAASYGTNDGEYSGGRLKTDGRYPKSAGFFNGRLVFAGTRNEPQRLFFSSVKKPDGNYNFATVKVFLTEKKEYVMVRGSVTNGSNIITAMDGQIPAFTKPLVYYVSESTFFNPPVGIEKISGNTITLTGNCRIDPVLSLAELDAFREWKFQATLLENSLTEREGGMYIGGCRLTNNSIFRLSLNIKFGISQVRFYVTDPSGDLDELDGYLLPQNSGCFMIPRNVLMSVVAEQDLAMAREQLKAALRPIINQIVYSFEESPNAFNDVMGRFYARIRDCMQYTVHGRTFYGYLAEIEEQLMEYNGTGSQAYIPFRAREIIKDEYPTPDCGFTFEIASDMNDAIRWITVNKGLVVGTEAAEWVIPPDTHATNAYAVLNSRNGSDAVQGAAAGDAVCFFQTGKKGLVEYYIPQADNHFRANNTALLAPQMLAESPAREFDYLSSPYVKFLVTREDGAMAALLYERSTGTFAWGRITTRGKIISAAVLQGEDGNDDAWLVVKRGNAFYLEKLREDGETYLDSYAPWDGDASGYGEGAAVYEAGGKRVAGYPYESVVRSMPILANNRMKPNNIKNLLVRFADSYMPKVTSLPNGSTDVVALPEPYTGVYKIPFPGAWDRDVMFEFVHDRPVRCKILAIFAEVN